MVSGHESPRLVCSGHQTCSILRKRKRRESAPGYSSPQLRQLDLSLQDSVVHQRGLGCQGSMIHQRNVFWRSPTTLVIQLTCKLLLLSGMLGSCRGQWRHSTSSTLGADFVMARLDHHASEGTFRYCQGNVTILLLNPHPTQVALVRIEAGGPSKKRAAAELSIDPGEQIEHLWKGSDCSKAADENLDDTSVSGDTPPRVLPAALGTSCRIRSSHPIEVYAAHGSLAPLASSAPRDLTMVLPTARLGKRYRLVNSDATNLASNPAPAAEQPTGNRGKVRKRYLALGVVAISDGSTSAVSSEAVVSVRNDVTGLRSANFTLRAGQVLWYAFQNLATDGTVNSPSDANLDDMTGWNVVATTPVAVFVGSYDSVSQTDEGPEPETRSESSETIQPPVSSRGSGRERLRFRTYQQILPESVLGNTYLVCPVEASDPIARSDEEGRSNCLTDAADRHDAACQDPITIPTRVRYIATRNDTVLTLTFAAEVTNANEDASAASSATSTIRLETAGQYYDLETLQPHQAVANQPIYVYQYMPSWSSSPSTQTAATASSSTGTIGIDVRSSSMMLVPSVDQLMLPRDTPAASSPSLQVPAKRSKKSPVRIAVQHDQSSLRILHAKVNRIALNDEAWQMMKSNVAAKEEVRSAGDGSSDWWERRRMKLQGQVHPECRTAGFINGVEYCCTQLNQVSSGIYTLSTISSSLPSDAEAVNDQYPMGVSVLGYVRMQVSSSRDDVGDTSQPDFEVTDLRNPKNSMDRSEESDSRHDSIRLRMYGYNGALEWNEVAATCSTGGPYSKRTYRFPSEAYEMNGKASCLDGSSPTRTVWKSLNPDDAVLTAPDQLTTTVRFLQPGVHTLCLDVSCGLAGGGGEPGSVTCCGTFEVNRDECDAGGPYQLESKSDNLPISVKLSGDIDACADGTQPIVSWFQEGAPKRKQKVDFTKADQLSTRAMISGYGLYDVCMAATCGKSELLNYLCCTHIKVGKVISEDPAPIPALPSQRPSVAPYSGVIQDSPTSRSAGQTQELPTMSYRDNEGKPTFPTDHPSSSGWAAREPLARPTRIERYPTIIDRTTSAPRTTTRDRNNNSGERSNFDPMGKPSTPVSRAPSREDEGRQNGESEGFSSEGGGSEDESAESGRREGGGEHKPHSYKKSVFGSKVMPLNIFFRGV